MVGRKDERARLKALLDAAREGRSGALLLHGPPGIGKTELLRYAIEEASGFRLLRARGIESESDIPFAGLAELVTPLLAHLDEIPSVQATALRGALALGPAPPPTASPSPPRCSRCWPAPPTSSRCWRSSTTRSGSTSRRWRRSCSPGGGSDRRASRSLAARDDAPRLDVPWLEHIAVAPLDEPEARALLDAEIAPGVADRLIATAAGNPLALLEIPGLLSAGQLAGREPLEDPLRPGTDVERAFAARVSALPPDTRRALLVAAAASSRRMDALVRAGVALETLEPAEAARIVALADGELEFRHPLLRSTDLPRRLGGGPARGARGAGRGHRQRGARLAPGGVRGGAGRGRRGGVGGGRAGGARTWRARHGDA